MNRKHTNVLQDLLLKSNHTENEYWPKMKVAIPKSFRLVNNHLFPFGAKILNNQILSICIDIYCLALSFISTPPYLKPNQKICHHSKKKNKQELYLSFHADAVTHTTSRRTTNEISVIVVIKSMYSWMGHLKTRTHFVTPLTQLFDRLQKTCGFFAVSEHSLIAPRWLTCNALIIKKRIVYAIYLWTIEKWKWSCWAGRQAVDV